MNAIPVWAQIVELLVAVCFILSLKGLSGPKTARKGSLIGSVGAFVAIIVMFVAYRDLNNLGFIIGAIVIGAVIGLASARTVRMTAMPQMVALFNAAGGGAAALVAFVEYLQRPDASVGILIATVFTIIVGSVAFTGSVLTFFKLQELVTTRPMLIPGGRYITSLFALAALAFAVWVVIEPELWRVLVLLGISAVLGLLLVMPVGGADVPIIISLLNAFTGLAVAASGFVLSNVLLLIAGTLVGASGALLTREMAKAMGRPLSKTLFGAFNAKPASASASSGDRPVRTGGPDDVAIMLAYAQTVVIVPGYGLAVAQAQHTIRELVDLLSERGVSVVYAIHPVAGRMPGHMNVLLAEANVPYDQLKEMDEVNPGFPDTDVALVVGANDVVNPAAKSDPSAPIYGIPILDVIDAKNVVFLKRSMRPGFAGVENELLFDEKTTLLFGDAKDSLTKVVTSLKNL